MKLFEIFEKNEIFEIFEKNEIFENRRGGGGGRHSLQSLASVQIFGQKCIRGIHSHPPLPPHPPTLFKNCFYIYNKVKVESSATPLPIRILAATLCPLRFMLIWENLEVILRVKCRSHFTFKLGKDSTYTKQWNYVKTVLYIFWQHWVFDIVLNQIRIIVKN